MTGLWFVLGAALGTLSVSSQWQTLAYLRHNAARRALFLVIGGAVLRWVSVSVLWVAALRHGILPGLSVLAGLWLARWAIVCYLNKD